MARPGLGGCVRRGGQARGEGPAGSLGVCVHTTAHARREDGDCAALVGQLHVGEDPRTRIVVQDHRLFGIAEHAGKNRFGLRAAHKGMDRGHPVGHRVQGECQPNRSRKK